VTVWLHGHALQGRGPLAFRNIDFLHLVARQDCMRLVPYFFLDNAIMLALIGLTLGFMLDQPDIGFVVEDLVYGLFAEISSRRNFAPA